MAKKIISGADYVAVRRLSDIDDNTFADVGETCESVPETSLPSLVQQGWIEKPKSKKRGR